MHLVLLAAVVGSVVPGPGEPDFDEALEHKADQFHLQLHQICTLPIGFGLDAKVTDPDNIDLLERFFASGERDFVAFSGKHPYEIVEDYGDYNHAAIFGAVQVAGDAFRYAVARDSGAPADEVDAARDIYVRNLDAIDWVVRVTGVPGVMARGIRRVVQQDGAPPIQGEAPQIVPFHDADGNPLPRAKETVYRADRSGSLPFLVWLDNASRDTVVGYVYALGVAYDVGAEDPTIPADKIEMLRMHARDIGLRFLIEVDVGADDPIDLVIVDWDGRPTTFHALASEEILEGFVDDVAANGFNAVMALGIMRTLYHVSGEREIYQRYRQLVGRRDYLGVLERAATDTLYFNEITNYSVVNMAYLAFYGVLRYEQDPALAARYRAIFEKQVYDAGVDRDGRGLRMSFFDFMFAGFSETGTIGIGAEAVRDGLAALSAHPSPPYWDRRVYQCDDAEIAALDCELDDGTRIALSSRRGYGGDTVVAVEPVPPTARVPSNFAWRADPHRVNGGGKPQINFGGDFYGAYWLGRFLKSSASGHDNISPIARGEPSGFEEETDCSCTAESPRTRPSWFVFGMLSALVLLRSWRGVG